MATWIFVALMAGAALGFAIEALLYRIILGRKS